MQYARVGSSNLKVSTLGLGAMGIGDPAWRNWVLDEPASRPIVKRCLDLGINLIDTCDFYSLGVSEEVVGRLIRDFVPRQEVVLATKAGNPMGKGPNARGYSRKHLFEAVDQSLCSSTTTSAQHRGGNQTSAAPGDELTLTWSGKEASALAETDTAR